ncbi:aromatic-ring-hydroxylating dioxygenase subunit beta [Pseudooceanicola sp. C21-150M6]|uniref:aromatic-ring-hydroxylating dioxygenase subunit beta n=1 Tax=Pseudooceanicola sp. C21-150M6 TaxID=3434355 RepID=UPI003D7F44FC
MTAQLFEEEALNRFIRQEIRYLNKNLFDPWIDLFTEDGIYLMPLDEDQADPAIYDMIMFDNVSLMKIRRENFGHPDSPSMAYPMRSMRMVSDSAITAADAESCQTETPFVASIYYQKMTWYAGTYIHHFRAEGEALKLTRKQVNLLDMGAPQGAIMTYL